MSGMEFEQHVSPPRSRTFLSGSVPPWLLKDLSAYIGSGMPVPREMLDTIRAPAGQWMVQSVEYRGGLAAKAELIAILPITVLERTVREGRRS